MRSTSPWASGGAMRGTETFHLRSYENGSERDEPALRNKPFHLSPMKSLQKPSTAGSSVNISAWCDIIYRRDKG